MASDNEQELLRSDTGMNSATEINAPTNEVFRQFPLLLDSERGQKWCRLKEVPK